MSKHRDTQGRPLSKHTLFLFEGDYQRLNDLFPDVKAAKVIRHLIRDLIARTDGPTPDIKVNLND